MSSITSKHLLAALFLLLGAATLLAAQTPTVSQDSGLLLGVRSVGKSRKYRTLWITLRGGTIEVKQLPGLLVPRDHGFSWAGHYFTLQKWKDDETSSGAAEPASFEEHVWIRPAEDASRVSIRAPLRRIQSDKASDRYCGEDFTTIAYIGPKYVSLEGAGSSSCGQNPAPSVVYSTWLVDELSLVNTKGHAMSGAELLGSERIKAIQRERDAAMDDDCTGGGDLGDATWTLFHREGRWAMKGWQQTAMQCGGGTEFDIHTTPPESFVGREALSLPWKEIISRIPGAIDALSSPRRDLLVVMTPSELQIFRTHGSEVGEPLRKFTLWVESDDPNETHHAIVMDQWAFGRYVTQWERVVMRQKGLRTSDQP